MDTNTDHALEILSQGNVTLKGEFLWGSNYTFLVDIEYQEQKLAGVYKPVRGERPLWDFPAASLAKREAAAYVVSQALGWRLVPPTVFRKTGPLGSGSLQLYIEHNPEYHYFNFSSEDIQRLRPTAVFDMLINNADRKGSHILKAVDDHLWLIDHGVCFHVEDKLRTVIWDFVDEPIPADLAADLLCLRDDLRLMLGKQASMSADDMQGLETAPAPGLGNDLLKLLSRAEVRALARRAEKIVQDKNFPNPDPNRRPFPWPQI